jgi:hypothetical protein
MATLGLGGARIAQPNARIEQLSAVVSGALWRLGNGNDRSKMPLWHCRPANMIITRTGSQGLR